MDKDSNCVLYFQEILVKNGKKYHITIEKRFGETTYILTIYLIRKQLIFFEHEHQIFRTVSSINNIDLNAMIELGRHQVELL